jgi:hypothetical protein
MAQRLAAELSAIGVAAASAKALVWASARAVVSVDIADRAQRRRRKHDAVEMMARIAAKRLVKHAVRFGFVVMKKPTTGGSAPISR